MLFSVQMIKLTPKPSPVRMHKNLLIDELSHPIAMLRFASIGSVS